MKWSIFLYSFDINRSISHVTIFFSKKEYTPLVKIYTSSIPFSGRACLDYPILHKISCLFILHFQHVPIHHLHILSHMPSLSHPLFISTCYKFHGYSLYALDSHVVNVNWEMASIKTTMVNLLLCTFSHEKPGVKCIYGKCITKKWQIGSFNSWFEMFSNVNNIWMSL